MRYLQFVILLFLIFSNTLSYSQPKFQNKYSIGFRGGISILNGYYSDEIDNGYNFGLYGLYYLDNFNKYLLAELDISYYYYSLAESESSEMIVSSITIGPTFYYPLFNYFQPFMGFGVTGNYLNLETKETNKSETTTKPGAKISAGFFVPLGKNILTKFTTDYSVFELSSKPFKTINCTVGVSYSFGSIKEEQNKRVSNLNENYNKGSELYKDGELEEAKMYFEKVYSMNQYFRNAKNYIEEINEILEKFNTAEQMINNNKDIEAIVLLEEISIKYKKAQNKLTDLRGSLKTQIKELESKGVRAFENNQYQICIQIMKKIISIEPNNVVANTYLPKAVKRYEAIKNLE